MESWAGSSWGAPLVFLIGGAPNLFIAALLAGEVFVAAVALFALRARKGQRGSVTGQ